MRLFGRILGTLQLMLFALLPGQRGAALPVEAGEETRCAPRQIRGMRRFLDPLGELHVFFPGCLAIGAPFVLYRLKREGFSNCRVQASPQGLRVQGRR